MQQVYILDIDGTLIPTHQIDNECYWEAVEQVFGQHARSIDLLDYSHVSDMGIIEQWCMESLGRLPTRPELDELRELFLQMIKAISLQQPHLFHPRGGLVPWLEQSWRQPGTRLAIATGGWGNTAAYKLEFSGLARFNMPLATSDDASRRTDIMRIAIERLRLNGADTRGSVTYIGDGPWDLLASKELGWSFIGIAEGERARTLKELGADRVFEDFWPLVRTTGSTGNQVG